jgi:small subunit ribosomal protein S19e
MAKTIFAKDPEKFVPALAEALKKLGEFSVPEWATFVKSGVSRERPPVGDDFWYIRAASILRQLYIHGVVGVGKLRTRYGSRKNRGGRASKFRKSGGKIIRVILQQAEAAGLVEKVMRMQHGRRLTAKGRELLDSIEVEVKEGLNFEGVTTKPKEVLQEDMDEEKVVEETTEVEGITEGESEDGE